MAMLHEHAAPVAELHGDRDGAFWMKPVDVLAAPLRRPNARVLAAARKDLSLFEVDVDRVVPVTFVVDQMPHFAAPELWCRRDPAVVRSQRGAAICADAPGTTQCGGRISA